MDTKLFTYLINSSLFLLDNLQQPLIIDIIDIDIWSFKKYPPLNTISF